jgi:hypothetical protein
VQNPQQYSDRVSRLNIRQDVTLVDMNETFRIGRVRADTEYRLIYQNHDSRNSKVLRTVFPTALSTSLMKRNAETIDWNGIYSLNGTTFTIHSPQPLLLTSCSESENIQDEIIYSIDKSKKLLVNPLAQWKSLPPNDESSLYGYPILWTSAVDDPYTLVALQAWEANSTKCTVCTVNAFWRMAKTTIFNNGLTQVKTEMPHQVPKTSNANLKAIQISTVIPEITDLSPDMFSHAEDSLGIAMAYALAGIPSRVGLNKNVNDFKGYDLSQLEGHSDITPFRIDTVNYGFGYGTRDTPTNLSVTAITAYCLIVVIYIGYIIITGHTSIAWNSPTELIMLALQSKEPTDLGHVSVGVDSMDTLRKSVGIRVSTEEIQGTGEMKEKLELVFEDDEENEKRGLTKVVRNRAY